jgi:hypothetical protein
LGHCSWTKAMEDEAVKAANEEKGDLIKFIGE